MKGIALKVWGIVLGLGLASGFAGPVSATVIDSADIAGLTTFQDTNTGRFWLDMDNFFDDTASVGTTGNDMIAAATAAGFTFALLADLEELLLSLPLTAGEWSTYAPIMGHGIPRQLIWGMYDDGDGNPFGWAWSYPTDTAWNFATNSTDANLVQNAGSSGGVDMGIWAFRAGDIVDTTVPEPATLALLGAAFVGARLRRALQKS